MSLTLSPQTDYRLAEQRLLGAVRAVYARYHDRIARQHAAMAQDLSLTLREPAPESQLRLTETGLEMRIRFPAPLDSAAAVDDEVTRALLQALEAEPRLELAGPATPTIRAAPAPARAGA